MQPAPTSNLSEPPADCPLCPRLVAFRQDNEAAHSDWFNGAVPSFGCKSAGLLIVGLAPGLKGANRTGRPFFGDHAGELLYRTLLKTGLARGRHDLEAPSALELIDCMITNAVRCAPPENKPTPAEETLCRPHLAARIKALPRLTAIVALGDVARRNVLKALSEKANAAPAGHGQETDFGPLRLYSSYHCSRLNTNTGRLTPAMFEAVFARVRARLDQATA
jgi:uracil-DNA glycosylase family 4